ncbi:MAG: VanZ family protein [Firmicutes bacterium]|nr:VanZ family protein [Bacillota bacterium]
MKGASKQLVGLVIYSVVIFILAVIPPVGVSVQRGNMVFKLHHIAAFMFHVIFVWMHLNDSFPTHRYLAFGISFVFGVLIEFVQVFLPYRTGSIQDLVQNALGIVIGLGVVYLGQKAGVFYRARRDF